MFVLFEETIVSKQSGICRINQNHYFSNLDISKKYSNILKTFFSFEKSQCHVLCNCFFLMDFSKSFCLNNIIVIFRENIIQPQVYLRCRDLAWVWTLTWLRTWTWIFFLSRSRSRSRKMVETGSGFRRCEITPSQNIFIFNYIYRNVNRSGR